MGDIKFKKIKENIISNGSRRLEFDYIDWNGHIKYDIRRWNDDGSIPYKGVTIEEHELSRLQEVLRISINHPKGNRIISEMPFNDTKAIVYENFGVVSETTNWQLAITYTDWGKGPKYDIRNWTKDFTKCGKGVTFSNDEAEKLLVVLEGILNTKSSNTNSPNIFNDINDDLLI